MVYSSPNTETLQKDQLNYSVDKPMFDCIFYIATDVSNIISSLHQIT